MNYIVEGKEYLLSYQELKEKYEQFINSSDEYFSDNIASVLHLVCIISFVKETPSYVLLNDEGLIHSIAHYMDGTVKNTEAIAQIRRQFNIWCKLS